MTTTRINGADLYYQTIGSGPPVLTIHGNGVDHTCLRPWHDSLADSARVIYFDQRWNGRSERIGPADHATWHADAAGLLDHLGEQKAVIFGHSYGAWLAMGFAARFPERVRQLILCGASPAFDYVDEVVATAKQRNPVAARALIDGLAVGVKDDAELARLWQEILPLYFHGPTRFDALARTMFSADGFTLALKALEGFSMVDTLPMIDVPILVLVGRYDYITPPSQARRLAALAPNATVLELPGSGHFPFVEEPDDYVAAFRAALR